MPNQRDKAKLYIGGFVEKEFQATLSRLAREAGMADNRFGFVALLLKEALQRRSRRGNRGKAGGSHSRPRPLSRRPG